MYILKRKIIINNLVIEAFIQVLHLTSLDVITNNN